MHALAHLMYHSLNLTDAAQCMLVAAYIEKSSRMQH